MGRNCINRQVEFAPVIKGFRPFGRGVNRRQQVTLALDEFEVIRLLDYLHLTQEEAAIKMQISRPTLTRIYEKARITFARALVEGCSLIIEGGDIQFKHHEYHCNQCHNKILTTDADISNCPQCNSSLLDSMEDCHRNKCKQCRKCYRGGRNAKT